MTDTTTPTPPAAPQDAGFGKTANKDPQSISALYGDALRLIYVIDQEREQLRLDLAAAREEARMLEEGLDLCADDRQQIAARALTFERERDVAREPIASSSACQRCGRRDGLDAVAPNDVWATLSEGRILGSAGEVGDGRWNLLCLWCMDALAVEKGIECSVSLHFAGRALNGTSDSDADQAHVSRLVEERDAAREEGDRHFKASVNWEMKARQWEREYDDAREEARKNLHDFHGAEHDALCLEEERDAATARAAELRNALDQLAAAVETAPHRPAGTVLDALGATYAALAVAPSAPHTCEATARAAHLEAALWGIRTCLQGHIPSRFTTGCDCGAMVHNALAAPSSSAPAGVEGEV